MRGGLYCLALFIIANISYANDYSESLKFAREKAVLGKSLFQQFNANELPEFTQNPKEAHLKPSQKGELESKGGHFVESNKQANTLYQNALSNKESKLDNASQKKAKSDYEKAENNKDKAPCDDGACIPVKNEQSSDFSSSSVELGALDGVAMEVKKGKLKSGMPGIFKAQNITCRTVYKYNRINFCQKDKDIFSASKAEKMLHKAQREKRAVVVSQGSTFCSKKKKIFGKRHCVEKKQSWCVFKSKLARIIQVEARRQLRLSFGSVYGDVNAADCKGLTPSQISRINFDTPQMRSALNEITSDYRAKVKPLQNDKARVKANDYIKSHQEAKDD